MKRFVEKQVPNKNGNLRYLGPWWAEFNTHKRINYKVSRKWKGFWNFVLVIQAWCVHPMSVYVYVYRCISMPVHECMCACTPMQPLAIGFLLSKCLLLSWFSELVLYDCFFFFFYELYIPGDVPNKMQMVLQQTEQHSMIFMSSKGNLRGMIIFAAQWQICFLSLRVECEELQAIQR